MERVAGYQSNFKTKITQQRIKLNGFSIFRMVDLSVAKSMKAPDSRRQGCSCSWTAAKPWERIRWAFMLFPEGKKFETKKMKSGCHQW